MKLSRLFVLAAAALLASSCSDFFFQNVFAGAREKPDVASMSATELKDASKSQFFLQQIREDSTLRADTLNKLETVYSGNLADPDPAIKADAQVAAATAATIIIKSDPAAAYVSASAVVAATSLSNLPSDPAEQAATITETITSILPPAMQTLVSSGEATAPAEFVAMITSFSEASSALLSLGGSAGGGITAEIGTEEVLPLAVNALISTLIISAKPDGNLNPTPEETAAALWQALVDPSNASTYVDIDSASIDLASGSDLGNLFTAAGISFN